MRWSSKVSSAVRSRPCATYSAAVISALYRRWCGSWSMACYGPCIVSRAAQISRHAILTQHGAEALMRAPQNLSELFICQIECLADGIARFFAQVQTLEHFAIARRAQLPHQLAHAPRESVVIKTLLDRCRLVADVRHEGAVAVVAMGAIGAPVRGSEVYCGAVQVAAEVARIIEPFLRADFLDRLLEGSLQ